jgi:hypothetical protein
MTISEYFAAIRTQFAGELEKLGGELEVSTDTVTWVSATAAHWRVSTSFQIGTVANQEQPVRTQPAETPPAAA